ncbi:MAG: MBL fold metallo-hydrolase [Streptosporangiales bacterium]|nr:MBL fold metallo-hydrolase [Streptosporangiales bacterium]
MSRLVRAAVGRSLTFGDATVSYVPDGVGALIPEVFLPTVDWHRYPQHLAADGTLVASLGGLLVQRDGSTLLIDTGYGPGPAFEGPDATARGLGPFRGGALLDNLAQFGVSPSDVDTVVVTHVHFDHVGWLVHRDRPGHPPVFPSARYLVAEPEWAFCRSHGDKYGQLDQETFFGPLGELVETFARGAEIFPGVTALPTPGHTPGHTSFVLAGGGRELVVVGDAAHNPVELEHPEHGARRDSAPAAARASRELLADLLARPDTVGYGMHFADVVLGTLDDGHWVPVDA